MTITIHPLTAADRVTMADMRTQLAPLKGTIGGPESRGSFDTVMERTPPADNVRFEEAVLNGVSGWWCLPDGAPADAAMFYLHGGGYVVGSAYAYRNFVSQLAVRVGTATFIPEYRLAPEHPFPAAYDDALTAYTGLAKAGYRQILLAGDSAGGGLALAILAELKAIGNAPVAAAVISPWTDLALTGASVEDRAEKDPLSTRASLMGSANLYRSSGEVSDPRVSPLWGDLSGLPPVQIHVGEDDILLDDTRRYAERMLAAGGSVDAHVWEGMPHVFPANLSTLDAAPSALNLLAKFLRGRYGRT